MSCHVQEHWNVNIAGYKTFLTLLPRECVSTAMHYATATEQLRRCKIESYLYVRLDH